MQGTCLTFLLGLTSNSEYPPTFVSELPIVVMGIGWTQAEQAEAVRAYLLRHPPPNSKDVLTQMDPFAGMAPYVVGFEYGSHSSQRYSAEPISLEPPDPFPLNRDVTSEYIQVTDAKSTGPDWSNKYIHDLLSASYPATPLGSRGIHSNNKVSIDRVFVGIRGNKYRSDPIHLKIISGNITEEDLKWEITSAPPNTLMLSGMHGYVQGTLSATPGLYSYNVRARVWLKPKMRNCTHGWTDDDKIWTSRKPSEAVIRRIHLDVRQEQPRVSQLTAATPAHRSGSSFADGYKDGVKESAARQSERQYDHKKKKREKEGRQCRLKQWCYIPLGVVPVPVMDVMEGGAADEKRSTRAPWQTSSATLGIDLNTQSPAMTFTVVLDAIPSRRHPFQQVSPKVKASSAGNPGNHRGWDNHLYSDALTGMIVGKPERLGLHTFSIAARVTATGYTATVSRIVVTIESSNESFQVARKWGEDVLMSKHDNVRSAYSSCIANSVRGPNVRKDQLFENYRGDPQKISFRHEMHRIKSSLAMDGHSTDAAELPNIFIGPDSGEIVFNPTGFKTMALRFRLIAREESVGGSGHLSPPHEALVRDWEVVFKPGDTCQQSNGPNGRWCSHKALMYDEIPFDGQFACRCTPEMTFDFIYYPLVALFFPDLNCDRPQVLFTKAKDIDLPLHLPMALENYNAAVKDHLDDFAIAVWMLRCCYAIAFSLVLYLVYQFGWECWSPSFERKQYAHMEKGLKMRNAKHARYRGRINYTSDEPLLVVPAMLGHLEEVKFILDNCPDKKTRHRLLHDTDLQGKTALHIAAGRGHGRVVEYLIKVAPDTLDKGWGSFPVHDAALGGHTRMMTAFLERLEEKVPGLVNRVNDDGESMLYSAARQGHAETVAELLGRWHADTEIAKASLGYTALHEAAKAGHVEVVKALLAAGASTEAVSASNDLPLHCATLFASEEEQRLKVDDPTRAGFVNFQTNTMVVDMILEGGADANAVGSKGGTALWHACGKVPAARRLVGDLLSVGGDHHYQASTPEWPKGLRVLEKAAGGDAATGQQVELFIEAYPFLDLYWTRQTNSRCSRLAKLSVWAVLLVGCRLGTRATNAADGEDGEVYTARHAAAAAAASLKLLPYLPTEMWHRILSFLPRYSLHPRARVRQKIAALKRGQRAERLQKRQHELFTVENAQAYAEAARQAKAVRRETVPPGYTALIRD